MKHHFGSIGLAVAAVALSATLSQAGGMILGGNVGSQSYTGNADSWNSALVYGATVDLPLSKLLQIGASISYSSTKNDNDGQDAASAFPGLGLSGTVSNELKNLQAGANVKLFPLKVSKLNPYLVAGIGYYQLTNDFSAGGYSTSNDAKKAGYRGGIGLRFMLNPMVGLSAEGDYNSVQTDTVTNFYGLRAGIVLDMGGK